MCLGHSGKMVVTVCGRGGVAGHEGQRRRVEFEASAKGMDSVDGNMGCTA